MSAREDRRIGSKPAPSRTPIAEDLKREVLHPWSKGKTHPVKEDT